MRSLSLGIGAAQKLELLSRVAVAAGFDGVAIFGDCFDEARAWWGGQEGSGGFRERWGPGEVSQDLVGALTLRRFRHVFCPSHPFITLT